MRLGGVLLIRVSETRLIGGGCATDRDEQSVGQRDLHGHSSGWILGEVFGEETVEFGKVGYFADQNGGVKNETELAAACFEHSVEIAEGLPCLRLETVASRFAVCRVDPRLTRHEQ